MMLQVSVVFAACLLLPSGQTISYCQSSEKMDVKVDGSEHLVRKHHLPMKVMSYDLE